LGACLRKPADPGPAPQARPGKHRKNLGQTWAVRFLLEYRSAQLKKAKAAAEKRRRTLKG
jgi:hypothetical protein